MPGEPSRLLCIDLQVDTARGLKPEPRCIFGARQLLVMGRRLGWDIAHTRVRRPDPEPSATFQPTSEALIGALRPLTNERLLMRPDRSMAHSPSVSRLLDQWRRETVYVAAFDHVALLSCLLECHETGPKMILVEDAIPAAAALGGDEAMDAFRATAANLASGTTTISALAAHLRRPVAALRKPA